MVLPFLAAIVHSIMGWRAISANHCSKQLRDAQYQAFMSAIFTLFFFDVTVVVMEIIPGAPPWHPYNLTLLSVGAPIYLALMSLAMYPGHKGS
jgi:hypothetical protein